MRSIILSHFVYMDFGQKCLHSTNKRKCKHNRNVNINIGHGTVNGLTTA